MSGADEKIVRVFDAPKVFLQSLKVLSRVEGLGDEVGRCWTSKLADEILTVLLPAHSNRDPWLRMFRLWDYRIELSPVRLFDLFTSSDPLLIEQGM